MGGIPKRATKRVMIDTICPNLKQDRRKEKIHQKEQIIYGAHLADGMLDGINDGLLDGSLDGIVDGLKRVQEEATRESRKMARSDEIRDEIKFQS